MSYQELTILFKENGSVSYRIDRSGFFGRVTEYEKQEFLEPLNDIPSLWRYREQFEIKGNKDNCFHLYLHGHHRRLSAVKASSSAFFRAQTDGYIHCCGAFKRVSYECSHHPVKRGSGVRLLPTELADAKFHCKGILKVNWVIEIDENWKGPDF